MNIEAEKIVLVRRLLDTDNEIIINQLKEVFDKNEQDFWDELPQHVKAGVDRSRKQAESGLFKSHDDVIKKYTSYL